MKKLFLALIIISFATFNTSCSKEDSASCNCGFIHDDGIDDGGY